MLGPTLLHQRTEETDEEFLAQLKSFKDVWNQREKEHLPAGKSPQFHGYISSKVIKM